MIIRKDQGFSLVEVLVALAIVGFALTAYYRLVGDSVRGRHAAELQELAMVRAANLIERTGVDLPALSGSGAFDDGMIWRIVVTPLGKIKAQQGSGPERIWLEVAIDDKWGRRLARIETGKVVTGAI